MIRKSKKITKLRGSRTCGYGEAKKHRGAGHRGGRGNAGVQKHKWLSICKFNPDYFGRSGFVRHASLIKDLKTINVGELQEYVLSNIDAFEKDGDKIVVDAAALGFDKILGKGRISLAMAVSATEFSENAVAKLEAAGGEAVEL
jgi:large subunit ribosomal protein L15